MTHLAKLTFKTVDRSMKRDPIIARRDKLVAGLKEQKLVHAAALKKEDHRVERDKWMTNDMGERVLVKTHRRIRPWFFEQDGGWYVQCRYGARVIAADGTNNAVLVKTLADVAGVLDAFLNAAAAGELDAAITTSGRASTTHSNQGRLKRLPMPDANTALIAALNDQVRQTFKECRVDHHSRRSGVEKMCPTYWIRCAVFDAFTPDNDPYGEHDFGAIRYQGTTILLED